mmetsp:Transcript_33823/g.50141  ORF Transcript_33823/g.50141 Transcript_33823/m.50141 type:complete len:265 (+) Transcript_33823:356-1150(+)
MIHIQKGSRTTGTRGNDTSSIILPHGCFQTNGSWAVGCNIHQGNLFILIITITACTVRITNTSIRGISISLDFSIASATIIIIVATASRTIRGLVRTEQIIIFIILIVPSSQFCKHIQGISIVGIGIFQRQSIVINDILIGILWPSTIASLTRIVTQNNFRFCQFIERALFNVVRRFNGFYSRNGPTGTTIALGMNFRDSTHVSPVHRGGVGISIVGWFHGTANSKAIPVNKPSEPTANIVPTAGTRIRCLCSAVLKRTALIVF